METPSVHVRSLASNLIMMNCEIVVKMVKIPNDINVNAIGTVNASFANSGKNIGHAQKPLDCAPIAIMSKNTSMTVILAGFRDNIVSIAGTKLRQLKWAFLTQLPFLYFYLVNIAPVTASKFGSRRKTSRPRPTE
jgi:hypothetical protein